MVDVNLNLLVRIVKVDYYLTKPISELGDPCYSGFRSLPIHHVPVIRVFGPTAEGTKCCVHIHGVFPYIYIPNWDHEIQEKDLYAFAASLDKAINTSLACSSSKTCHIHRISTASCRPYYGYYEDEKEFLKIEFYNPALIRKASDLLLNGSVFNHNYQPYEAHVPYVLQFFIDNNLYGMSYVTFSSWQIRSETAKGVLKQTTMTLEVDSSVKYIIRQCLSGDGVPNNPGLMFIWDEERKRKKLLKGESQITPNVSQSRPDREATRTESYYKHRLREQLIRFNRNSNNAKPTTDEVEDEITVTQLNSQGKEIMSILNELIACNKVKESEKKASSICSSPSIVFSDNSDETQERNAISSMEVIRSQPLLKQTAESDSILGDDFSDDEVDQEDHLLLSQSIRRHQPAFSSDDEFDNEVINIPQLDGADGINTASVGKQSNKVLKTSRYNLRSINAENRKQKDKKSTPKKQYPQLEIATQISPKVTTGSPSVTESPNFRPAHDIIQNSFFPDNLCSQTSISPSEGRKSESRRLYPPLNLNFRKSPRNDAKIESGNEVKRRRLKSGISKRKIDFDELPGNANNDTLLTTRWKKLQQSKKIQKSSSTSEKNHTDKLHSVDVEDFKNSTYIIKDQNNARTNVISNPIYSTNSETDSQQYNLKIRLDACASLDRQMVLKSLLTKEPVVIMEKLKTRDELMLDTGYTNHCRDSGSELKHTVPVQSLETNKDFREEDSFNLDDASPTLPYEFNDYSFGGNLSKLERNEDDALASSSKSDHSSECNSLKQLSSETKISAEVNFWDIGETKPLNIDEPNSALSQTVIASFSSEGSVEFDDCNYQRMHTSSQNGEFYNQRTTHDFVNKESCEYKIIDHEAISSSSTSLRDESVATKKRSHDLGVEELSFTLLGNRHLLETTNVLNKENKTKTSVCERGSESKTMIYEESMATLDDESDPEIFSQSNEECRALTQCILPFTASNCTENRDTLKYDRNSAANFSYTANTDETCDRQHFVFDSSAWDTAEKTKNERNDVLSFYGDDSVSVVNATIFCDKEASNDEAITPENVPEIVSWNAEDSLYVEQLSGENSRNKLSKRLSNELSSNDDSLPASKRCVLHSTPHNAGKKKSPSPTYTPILKKLMLRKMKAQNVDSRSRLRFQEESCLADIKEEEMLKDENGVARDNTTTTTRIAEKSACEQKSVGSGLIDLTMPNTYGFRMSLENLQNVKTETKHQHITVMSVEVFPVTRENLCPDPEVDSVHCIFYSVFHDAAETPNLTSGIIMVSNEEHSLDMTRFNCEKQYVMSENELFDNLVALVEKWNPDIFVGYEIEMLSWGYIIERAQYLGRNYVAELSRMKEEKQESLKERTLIEDNEYSDNLKLVGRIVLNVWRLMRHEIALQSYTFENILFHVLHQRAPKHSFRVLTDWWKNSLCRWIVIDYYLLRVESNILLLQQLDFFGRTSELARLFGIQFYEVLSRGSQFRVESMMLRLAKKQNFVAVSPSVKQRAKMRAPESLPLIMEPESKFYTDPVIVLDFQSLYPSIIIAYNYCFSTCLGRVEHLAEKDTFNLGCIQHTVPAELVAKLESSLNISPCGVAFVQQDVRRGILPEMLDEILNTRLMVKKSMKENNEDKTLQRVLHARQLGLKLIANVTYGYTSANFSGRMPCIEVGDSVVSKGRETLERAIEMVSKNEKWAAKVVYGDTDSMFVLVPKRTKEEAFRIGAEIAEAVTRDNPKPVKLKFEKVYYPCILQTKKRYVGYMYESLSQKEPSYDAKGIETVRRDGCPAVSKILEKSLKLLFEYNDVDRVKQYVQRQFAKLVAGRLSIQELTFAREYRGMNNYKPAACVPALQLARRAIIRDRRSEPRTKERVRYVLTVGAPGVPLIKSVCTPEEFLSTPGAIINAEYYITRAIIPALERCFSLMGVDVKTWYTELPRKRSIFTLVENIPNNKARKKTISHYFATSKCVACEEISVSKICANCQRNPQRVALILGSTINKLQGKHNYLEKICRSCTSRDEAIECLSLDCPVYYSRHRAITDVGQVPSLEKLQQTFLCCSNTNDK